MKHKILTLIFLLLFPSMSYGDEVVGTYRDSSLPVEERVKDLISKMSLKEKIAQLCMKPLDELRLGPDGQVDPASLERLFGGEGIGCLTSPFVDAETISKLAEAADRYLRTETRLGVPALQTAECIHGVMALGATVFPQSIAQGATWNPELVERMGGCIAEEAASIGVTQALSPLFDLALDPRYGRVEECFGEDPELVSTMGTAYVRGMQGRPESAREGLAPHKVACTAKHFAAYSFPQSGLNLAPAMVGERALRELFFPPFEAAVKEAGVYSVMPGYHEIDGIPVHADKWLLTDVLKKEWGFEGYVISDAMAIWMLDNFHRVSSGPEDSACKALTAGVDVEMPSDYAYSHLEQLVNERRIEERLIDEAVVRVLRVKFKAGLFDRPYRRDASAWTALHDEGHIRLAREMAEESAVLLENKNHLLPLNKSEWERIAVIGPNADRVQFGDYSVTKSKEYGVTVLDGIRNALENTEVDVCYAEGCKLTGNATDGFEEAVELVKFSDLVIMVLGGTSVIYSGIGWGNEDSWDNDTCGEGFDRDEIGLPGVQSELLEQVAAIGKPIVVVMMNGRPYTLVREAELASAILEVWYPGEQGGNAVADILFGKVNPSGRLPVSFPRSVGQIPVYASHKPSAKGFYKEPGTRERSGRDYVNSSPYPLYCLGYGLSYTSFGYTDLEVLDSGKEIEVSFVLTNTGSCPGGEVAQVYVNDRVSSVTTPVRKLVGFQKVFLNPGESRRVTVPVSKKKLELWNNQMEQVLENGEFQFFIGSSWDNIELTTLLQIPATFVNM